MFEAMPRLGGRDDEGIRLYDNPGAAPIRLRRAGQCDPASAVNLRYLPAVAATEPTGSRG